MVSFPHLPTTDFEGCTRNFETLLPLLNASERQTTKGGGKGGLSTDFSEAPIELTLTAGEVQTQTVSHALGVVPRCILITGAGTSSGGVYYWEVTAPGTTSFVAVLRHTGNITATVKANWLAIA